MSAWTTSSDGNFSPALKHALLQCSGRRAVRVARPPPPGPSGAPCLPLLQPPMGAGNVCLPIELGCCDGQSSCCPRFSVCSFSAPPSPTPAPFRCCPGQYIFVAFAFLNAALAFIEAPVTIPCPVGLALGLEALTLLSFLGQVYWVHRFTRGVCRCERKGDGAFG